MSVLQGLFPMLNWWKGYSLNSFQSDLTAGLTLASLSIPQGKRNKKLFWVSDVAPVLSVALSTLMVYVTRADKAWCEDYTKSRSRQQHKFSQASRRILGLLLW